MVIFVWISLFLCVESLIYKSQFPFLREYVCRGSRNIEPEVVFSDLTSSSVSEVAGLLALEKAGLFGLKSNVFTVAFVKELDRIQSYFHEDERYRKEKGMVSRHAMVTAVESRTGTCVGYIDIEGRPSPVGSRLPMPYISDCVVHCSWRRQGIASLLLTEAVKRVRSWGRHEIFLYVDTTNSAALGLYRANGFVPVCGESGALEAPDVVEPFSGRAGDEEVAWAALKCDHERLLLWKSIV